MEEMRITWNGTPADRKALMRASSLPKKFSPLQDKKAEPKPETQAPQQHNGCLFDGYENSMTWDEDETDSDGEGSWEESWMYSDLKVDMEREKKAEKLLLKVEGLKIGEAR